jgi:hypothetical protein
MDLLRTTEACTLPTAQRPLRLAEFDSIFSSAVQSVTRTEAEVVIRLVGNSGLREQIRDLAERETACCSFFTFAIEGGDDEVELRVSVPPARRDILDALASRAEELSR